MPLPLPVPLLPELPARRCCRRLAQLRRAAFSFLLVGVISPATLRAQRSGDEVARIQYVGNRALPNAELKHATVTRANRCRIVFVSPFCKLTPSVFFISKHYLDLDEVGRDAMRIRALYWAHGYREATVDTAVRVRRNIRHQRLAVVTFRVHEGEPVRVAALDVTGSGAAMLGESEMHALIAPLAVGGPVDLVALDTAAARIRRALWNRGYADATIAPATHVDSATGRATVAMTIDANARTTVGEIRVVGNSRLSDESIRRGLWFGVGDPYTEQAVLRSQRTLFQSRAFERALIVVPPEGDSVKRLTVTVTERSPRSLRTTIGASTLDLAQLDARYTERYLPGAWRLEARAAVANLFAGALGGRGPFADPAPGALSASDESSFHRPTWQAVATLAQPWLFGPTLSFSASAFAFRRVIPSVVVEDASGVSTTLVRQLGPGNSASAGWRLERGHVRAGDVYFCQDAGICDAATAGRLRESRQLAPIGAGVVMDHTNDAFEATAGWTLRADAEHASSITASDYRHERVFGEGALYHHAPKGTLAFRVRGGAARAPGGIDELHPRKRFFAGGTTSLRGYGENGLGPLVLRARRDDLLAAGCPSAAIDDGSCDASVLGRDALFARAVGGTALLEGTAEWRLHVNEKLGVVGFVDAGWVGAGRDAIARSAASVTPGIGIRFFSTIGPIRLDLGVRPGGDRALPVVTSTADGRVVQLARDVQWRPRGRLAFHFSMGEAF